MILCAPGIFGSRRQALDQDLTDCRIGCILSILDYRQFLICASSTQIPVDTVERPGK
jgi:hypothetical protein